MTYHTKLIKTHSSPYESDISHNLQQIERNTTSEYLV